MCALTSNCPSLWISIQWNFGKEKKNYMRMWFQTKDSCEHESPALFKVWGGWRHGPHLATSSKVRRLCMPVWGEDTERRDRSSGRYGACLTQMMRGDHRCGCRKEGRPFVNVPTRGRRLGTDGEEDTTQRRLQPAWDDEERKHAFTEVFQIWSVFIARGCMFTELSLPALQIDFQ